MTRRASDRLLPHDLDAERAVLGAILLRNDAIDRLDELQSPDFFRAAHRTVYESMLRLRQDDVAIDFVTVIDDLKRRDELDDVGPAYVASLIDGVPTSTNVEHYASIIIEKARLRSIISATAKAATAAYDAEGKAVDLAVDAAERLLAIGERTEAGRAVSLAEIVPGGMDAIRRAAETGSIVTGLASGYVDLDELTAGFQPADVVIVAARTSLGKTSFVMSMARNIAGRCAPNRCVQVHSLEMPKEQLFLRLLAAEARIEVKRLRAGHLTAGEWARVDECARRIATLPIYIDDTAGVSCREITARHRALVAQGIEPVAIIIDYIQLMRASGKFDNRTQEVGSISRGVKAIAKKVGVPVIVLAQLNRSTEMRRDHKPQLSDLRESGDIEQDADTVLLLWRPDDADDNTVKVLIAKQRNGPLGSVALAFFDYCTRFESLAAERAA